MAYTMKADAGFGEKEGLEFDTGSNRESLFNQNVQELRQLHREMLK